MDRSKILTMLSLLKSSGIPVPVCCQWVKKIDKSKILTWPSPFRSPVTDEELTVTVALSGVEPPAPVQVIV